MAKIRLGAPPATFKPFPVKFTMPDGSEGAILATFKYRSRKDFGKLLNAMFAVVGKEIPAAAPDAEAKPIDFEALFAETGEKNAEHLLASLFAWDLDGELTLDNLQAVCDEYPAGAAALMAAYSRACNEGHLGN